jgi:sporulation protein YlmC with PRC-barrel domain
MVKMLKIMKISETLKKRVYTDSGDYFGDIEEANLDENKIAGWRIKVANHLTSSLGGARGVIIPHNFVKAVGDIIIISKASLPSETAQEPMMGKNVELA